MTPWFSFGFGHSDNKMCGSPGIFFFREARMVGSQKGTGRQIVGPNVSAAEMMSWFQAVRCLQRWAKVL